MLAGDDIQCSWGSLSSIIEHWGVYGSVLVKWAAPGYWHDPDMLLIGCNCISDDEARTQMGECMQSWVVSMHSLIAVTDTDVVTVVRIIRDYYRLRSHLVHFRRPSHHGQ